MPARQLSGGSSSANDQQKYVYHSSNHQHLNGRGANHLPNNGGNQGYQYSHSYTNNAGSNNLSMPSVPRMSGQQHGGQNLSFMPPHHPGNHSNLINNNFSQGHQPNQPSHSHAFNDEQLLEDLPGDDNMQKLF